MKKKRELIECFLDLILELNHGVTMSEGTSSVWVLPSYQGGQCYPLGVKVIFHDGFNYFDRYFYFTDTFREEFFRYMNRTFKLPTIARKVDELFEEWDGADAA